MSQREFSLQTIWEAIQQSKAEMTAHIDTKLSSVQTMLNNIQGSLSTLNDQITELVQRVSGNEDNVEDLTKRVAALEKENSYLRERVDDAENRSRANNLRFLLVPESSEGTDTVGFLQRLIRELFGGEGFAVPPVIERAHRSPRFNSKNNARSPRPILAKFLYYQDKVKILGLAREKKDLIFHGSRIMIYPDFSADLTKKRRGYDEVKKRLRAAGMSYSLLYPCSLRVMVNGEAKVFRSPEDVRLQQLLRDVTTAPGTA